MDSHTIQPTHQVRPMNFSELKPKPIAELINIAQEAGIENTSRMRKQDIVFALLKAHAAKGEKILTTHDVAVQRRATMILMVMVLLMMI